MSADVIEIVKLSPDQLEVALTSSEWAVRKSAIEQGGLTAAQMDRALGDELFDVRYAAEKQRSFAAAQVIACDKEGCVAADISGSRCYEGVMLGTTDLHVVQSLGKTAVAHLKANLSTMVEVEEMFGVVYDGSKGRVVSEREIEVSKCKGR